LRAMKRRAYRLVKIEYILSHLFQDQLHGIFARYEHAPYEELSF